MRATQSIFRVRRQYNKWVGDETLEDYALRFTAKSARRWSIAHIGTTALGATAFLALEALSAAATLQYGFTNMLWAMLAVAVAIFVIGFPISYYSARHGLDIDLLTRGGGFGYLGSTITSLIYASFTFIFFAIEAAIFASALQALFSIPLWLGYIISAVVVVPIVTHGITAISRFQVGSQPLWLLLQCVALVAVLAFQAPEISHWIEYQPRDYPQQGFNLTLFGACVAIFFAMIAQIGEQVDYLRFMPPKTQQNRVSWWFWLVLSGPGWIVIGVIKMLLGSFLAYLALTQMAMPFEKATDPVYLYQVAFSYLTQPITESPQLALFLSGVMVILSQMKINVTNAYAGSIAWSNFFSRLTHSHPGRVVWLIFNVAIALMLMELGIYQALEAILGIFAIVAISWLASLAADLLINKPLGLSPPMTEFKRAHLHDINPVGVGSMVLSSALGLVSYLGYLGDTASHVSHFISLAACFVLVPAIAYLTKGRFYLARNNDLLITHSASTQLTCCICESDFETEDMSHCPAYQGPICSLCCSLDARCLDACKQPSQTGEQLNHWLNSLMPAPVSQLLNSRITRFIGVLVVVALLIGAFLGALYNHLRPDDINEEALLRTTLWMVFYVLLIISGVVSWLMLLAHESRRVAQQESNRQTQLLIEEIEAHQETDKALQQAKEQAENANNAKSRYLSGISHELRTPLQSILGYAQLLSEKQDMPQQFQQPLFTIRNSGEYLAGLIEGLLDISKIEVGRLEIYRNQVRLPELLQQMVDMFREQARLKGIDFHFHLHNQLPKVVMTDEKRLRQILINLLSNAVKYTHQGRVDFHVHYRNQVAEFAVIDTGIGIHQDDLERIFTPFERLRHQHSEHTSGTGLGLTIVRLLTDIMGGNLSIKSTLGEGSCFTVSMMLSWVAGSDQEKPVDKIIRGYEGDTKTIMVVDDEPLHRGLLSDILTPLGFDVIEASSGNDCLQQLKIWQSQERTSSSPDAYILDVNMPDMSGLELAQLLRQRNIEAPIMMLSAEAHEKHRDAPISTSSVNTINNDSDTDIDSHTIAHDEYMVKPIRNQLFLDKLGKLLNLQWLYWADKEVYQTHLQDQPQQDLPQELSEKPLPEHPLLEELLQSVQIGHRKGALALLDQIQSADILPAHQLARIQKLAHAMRFDELEQLLETRHA